MKKKKPQLHWYDKEIQTQLDNYDLLNAPPESCFARINELAAASTGSSISMFILSNKEQYWLHSTEDLDEGIKERLVELALYIKDGEPESWEDLKKQPFFWEMESWEALHDYRFFYAVPVQPMKGPVLGWLCLFDFIPKKINDKLRDMMKMLSDMLMDELDLRLQVKRSDRIQKDLVYLAAHDLKNPLGGIMGITEHLKKRFNQSEEALEYCHLINDSSKRMLHIIDEMLSSAYLETGKLELKYARISLTDLIDYTVNAYKPHAQKKGQRFELIYESTPEIDGDMLRLQEIFENLISNAVKYAPLHSVITIKVSEQNNRTMFSIHNEGTGLSEEDRQKVFGKFSKLSARPTGGEPSTGLGLSIVKKLVEMHGGEVRAHSEGINKGVTFFVELPNNTVDLLHMVEGEW
jgi:signal transduction histidine kinase